MSHHDDDDDSSKSLSLSEISVKSNDKLSLLEQQQDSHDDEEGEEEHKDDDNANTASPAHNDNSFFIVILSNIRNALIHCYEGVKGCIVSTFFHEADSRVYQLAHIDEELDSRRTGCSLFQYWFYIPGPYLFGILGLLVSYFFIRAVYEILIRFRFVNVLSIVLIIQTFGDFATMKCIHYQPRWNANNHTLEWDTVHGYVKYRIGAKTYLIFAFVFVATFVTIYIALEEDYYSGHKWRQFDMFTWRISFAVFALFVSCHSTYWARTLNRCIFLDNGELQMYSVMILTEGGDVGVSTPSSKEDIRQRIQDRLQILLTYRFWLQARAWVTLFCSGLFFTLNVGVFSNKDYYDHDNVLRWYNMFMVCIMATQAFTSFESVTGFNKFISDVDKAAGMKTHLQAEVSSYVVDSRVLQAVVAATLLQMILKVIQIRNKQGEYSSSPTSAPAVDPVFSY